MSIAIFEIQMNAQLSKKKKFGFRTFSNYKEKCRFIYSYRRRKISWERPWKKIFPMAFGLWFSEITIRYSSPLCFSEKYSCSSFVYIFRLSHYKKNKKRNFYEIR